MRKEGMMRERMLQRNKHCLKNDLPNEATRLCCFSQNYSLSL